MKSLTVSSDSVSNAKLLFEVLQKQIDSWFEIGEFCAKCVEQDPEFPDRVHELCPQIAPEYIHRFVAVGLKKIHPRLLLSAGPGVTAVSRLPLVTQEHALANGVQLLTENGEFIMADVLNLSSAQAKQVFSPEGIRSLAGQRTWLEDQKTKSLKSYRTAVDYEIKGGELVVYAPCRISKKAVAQLNAQMD